MNASGKGVLYLVPVLLGGIDPAAVIPEIPLKKIRSLKSFIAENAKTARSMMKLFGMDHPFSEITVKEIDKHSKTIDFEYFFEDLRRGIDAGLVSEAGMPGIADPGSLFVQQAHKEKIKVIPFTGPSSLFLALAASGLNGQGFAFNGYLPKEKSEKTAAILNYERIAKKTGQTQIFIETPYRNQQLFNDLLQTCNPETKLCIASNLTLEDEFILTLNIAQWKQQKIDLNKKPAVFLIL